MRILWLKTELLHPVDKGGKIRTYQILRALRRNHHVTYLTLDDGTAAADAADLAQQYCHQLVRISHRPRAKFSAGFYFELAANLFSVMPYFVQKYESNTMRREVAARASGFDVLVCDFLNPAVNVPRGLGVPTVLFEHNVEAMIWKRHYEIQTDPLKKAYLRGQWRKASAYERDQCRRFDAVIAVSPRDAETIRRDYGVACVSDVPTGVDTEYFRPREGATAEPHTLVFTGSMDWLPNEDAIQFFTRDILPLIRARVPDVKLMVVGRKPYASLRQLSERDPSIVVTGRVEDVRPYVERAAVYIVPVRVGGGTRLKIYEAMAMGRPVVSTSVGAEGLPLRDSEHLLLSDTPRDFAAAVVRLLTDERARHELGTRAAATVRQQFGWDKAATVFAECCERVITLDAHRRVADECTTGATDKTGERRGVGAQQRARAS